MNSENQSERKIAQWTTRPYHGIGKRGITVEHRIVANYYPGMGADIRHEIRCPKRDVDDWTPAETWEMREYGTQKVETSAYKELP